MVLGQSLDVVIEGVQAGGDDSGLAHGAADLLLDPPGLVDEVAPTGEHGADRRAQALGEVDPEQSNGAA